MKYNTSIFIFSVMLTIPQLAVSAVDILDSGGSLDGKTRFEVFKQKSGSTEKTFYSLNQADSNFSTPAKLFESKIKIRDFDFDPLEDFSDVNSGAKKPGQPTNANSIGLFLVQLFTHPVANYAEEINNIGCQIVGYVPAQTYVVSCPLALAQRLSSFDYVRSVSEYKSEYKIQKKTANLIGQRAKQKSQVAPTRQRYIVSLFSRKDADLIDFEQFLLKNRMEIALKKSVRLGFPEVNLTDAQLKILLEHPNVQAIDEWSAPEFDMNIVREVGGANYVEQQFNFYTGLGVTGEVVDAAMVSHGSFKNIKPYGALGLNSQDAGAYHGTSTYGIIFSNGAEDPQNSSGLKRGRGLLPDATGVFSVRNLVDYSREQDLSDMTNPAGPYRIVFQSNSWGHPVTPSYDVYSQQLDQSIYDHDVIVLQSQGNTGNVNSRPEAWSKNVVSVGGVDGMGTVQDADDLWDSGASHGSPTSGKVKPDFVHFSQNVFTSTFGSGGLYDYEYFSGTSASTPIVAGYFGLMFQMWADGIFTGKAPGVARANDAFTNKPHAATAKALMVNTAYQYNFDGINADFRRYRQGWGRPDVKNLYDVTKNNNWNFPLIVDGSDRLKQFEQKQYTVNVKNNSSSFLKVTMAYMDPPIAISETPTNDLDVKLISPTGVVYWGNNGLLTSMWSSAGGNSDVINTVENIFIKNPEVGDWKVIVIASRVYTNSSTPSDSAYGLVVSCNSSAVCSYSNPNTHQNTNLSWLVPVLNLMLLNK